MAVNRELFVNDLIQEEVLEEAQQDIGLKQAPRELFINDLGVEPPVGPQDPRRRGIGGPVAQVPIQIVAGGIESIAESSLQLAQLIPGTDFLKEKFPGGQTAITSSLEEIGLLAEIGLAGTFSGNTPEGTAARMGRGTGEVAGFFLPVNIASKYAMAAGFPKLIAQFLPLGLGSYASLKSNADAEGREVGKGEVALAAAQAVGGLFAGKAGEKALGQALRKVEPVLRAKIVEHASNAALGAAFEAAGLTFGGASKQEIAEGAVEGAVGSLLAGLAANRFPGVPGGGFTAKGRAAGTAEVVEQALGLAKDINNPNPSVPTHAGPFIPRSYFVAGKRNGQIREAAVVDQAKWPGWLQRFVAENVPGIDHPSSVIIAERVKAMSAAGFESREVATALKREGLLAGTREQNHDVVRALKAKLGIPSMRDEYQFTKWSAAFTEEAKQGQQAPGGAAETTAPQPGPQSTTPPAEANVTVPSGLQRFQARAQRTAGLQRGQQPAEPEARLARPAEGPMGEDIIPPRAVPGTEVEIQADRAQRAVEYAVRIGKSKLEEAGPVSERDLVSLFKLTPDAAKRALQEADRQLGRTSLGQRPPPKKAAGQREVEARQSRRERQQESQRLARGMTPEVVARGRARLERIEERAGVPKAATAAPRQAPAARVLPSEPGKVITAEELQRAKARTQAGKKKAALVQQEAEARARRQAKLAAKAEVERRAGRARVRAALQKATLIKEGARATRAAAKIESTGEPSKATVPVKAALVKTAAPVKTAPATKALGERPAAAKVVAPKPAAPPTIRKAAAKDLEARRDAIQAELGKRGIPGPERRIKQAEIAAINDELGLQAKEAEIETTRRMLREKREGEKAQRLATREEIAGFRKTEKEAKSRIRSLRNQLKLAKGKARTRIREEIRNAREHQYQAVLARYNARLRARGEEEVFALPPKPPKKPDRDVRLQALVSKHMEAIRKAERAGEAVDFDKSLNKALKAGGFTRDEYEGRNLLFQAKRTIGIDVGDRPNPHLLITASEGYKEQVELAGPSKRTPKRFRATDDQQVKEFLEVSVEDMASYPEGMRGLKWLSENKQDPFYKEIYARALELQPKGGRGKKNPIKDANVFGSAMFVVSAGALMSYALAKDDEEGAVTAAGIGVLGLLGRRGMRRAIANMRLAQDQARVTQEAIQAQGLPWLQEVKRRHALGQSVRRGVMPPEYIERIQQAAGSADPAVLADTVGFREPGAAAAALKPVLKVIREYFGEHGKWIADRADRALAGADQREGLERQRLKQIRIPGPKSALHPKGRTAADPMSDAERLNAMAIWNNYAIRYYQLPGYENLPAPPRPMNKHVETILEAGRKYYYGVEFESKHADVRQAAGELVAYKQGLYPKFAAEAQELGIHVLRADGTLIPFQPHYTAAGVYEPHMMAREVHTMKMGGKKSGEDFVLHNEYAKTIQSWMVKHMALKNGVSEGEAFAALTENERNQQNPFFRYTLDAQVKRAGNVELSRYIDTPIGIEIDPAVVIPKYVRPAILRFEYAKQFGRTGKQASDVIAAATAEGYKGQHLRDLFDLAMEQTPELLGNHGVDAVIRELTGIASITKLPLAGLSQLYSAYPILRATVTDANPLRASNYKAFFTGFGEAVSKSLVDLGLSKDQSRRVRAELVAATGGTLEAERVNWVMQMSGFFPKVATAALHSYFVVPIDRFLRSWASAAGRSFADVLGHEMQNAIRAGDVARAKQVRFHIQDMNLGNTALGGEAMDPVRDFAHWDTLSPALKEQYRNNVGWTVAFRTQHRTRAADLPQLATHPYVRAIYKFSPFAIRQTQESIRQIRSEILGQGVDNPHGRVSRGLRYLALMAPAGLSAYAIGKIRAIIREPDDEKREAMAAKDSTLDKLVNLIAAANFFPWIADWVESASMPLGLGKRLLGPVYGQVLEASEYVVPGLRRGDPGPALRYLVRSFGVPIVGGGGGTPIGRLLKIPSGKELLEQQSLADVPVVGKYLRTPPPGQPSVAESELRSQSPEAAKFLLGERPANRRKKIFRDTGGD